MPFLGAGGNTITDALLDNPANISFHVTEEILAPQDFTVFLQVSTKLTLHTRMR